MKKNSPWLTAAVGILFLVIFFEAGVAAMIGTFGSLIIVIIVFGFVIFSLYKGFSKKS